MATKRARGGRWEFVVRRAKLLERPLYLTFETEQEGDQYCEQLERLLDQGIVPEAVRERTQKPEPSTTVAHLARAYRQDVAISRADNPVLDQIVINWGRLPVGSLGHDWADEWVTSLKRERKLAPSTIRHYVGTFARALDWGVRRGHLAVNPLRGLRKGYASYSDTDTAAAGGRKTEQARDRRLEHGEESKIMAALDSMTTDDAIDQRTLFIVSLASGMRLSEMTTLKPHQVRLNQRLIRLEKTKSDRTRDVPLSSAAALALTEQLERSEVYVWPWLEPVEREFMGMVKGDLTEKAREDIHYKARAKVTAKQSKWWARLFRRLEIERFTFHCLRHESASRVFENSSMTEREIMKMFGWTSWDMVDRYSHLRASDQASKLDW